jgi:hypothetical protein
LREVVNPFGSVEFVGVTPIDTRVAVVTESVVVPDTVPRAAVIVVDPGLRPAAIPAEPGELLTEATVEVEELQVTALVRS